ncbi:DNA-binding protein HU-beta [Microvirga lupini]|uniref:DNA-binding protein HU-beta n=1 Tax=Microvirga lupini TaxID=420324 RepID=A0A7W4VI27_9HYPH|nr:HU family DNA-binding protein [Microvirga lupini]MBB3017609.1 DNA-binding protein HU-beta [Microvirga lupini]
MNKQQMIDAIFEHVDLPKAGIRAVLESAAQVTKQALYEGEEVTVVGLGKLKPIDKKARTARNPKTGEPVQIEAKRVVKFVPAAELKSAIN